MNMKVLVKFAIMVAVIAGAVLFFRGGYEAPSPSSDSAGLAVGQNSIYVADQAPKRDVSVAVVRLQRPGFVAVHEDAAGTTGGILGVSERLPAGETQNPGPIQLSRLTQDRETLYVMLHFDDGDGVFDAVKDLPALDSVTRQPVMMIITVSTDATEPGAVSL